MKDGKVEVLTEEHRVLGLPLYAVNGGRKAREREIFIWNVLGTLSFLLDTKRIEEVILSTYFKLYSIVYLDLH